MEFYGVDHDEAVSIRAPVKGATHVEAPENPSTEVSIRAPVKGATPERRFLRMYIRFNPRSREGSDFGR